MAALFRYNGCTLPALPEWDKSLYPFAMIVGVRSAFSFHLVCHGLPLTGRVIDGKTYIGYEVGTKVYDFTYSLAKGDTDWVDRGDVSREAGSEVVWHYYNDVSEWIWCDHDILDESGNLVHAATVPEPVTEMTKYDIESWLCGYALALHGAPLPDTAEPGTPIAYRYGPITLPYEATWDSATRPYAMLLRHKDLIFYCSDKPLILITHPTHIGFATHDDLREEAFNLEALGVWYKDAAEPIDPPIRHIYGRIDVIRGTEEVLWANYDIKKSDGTLVLAGSDPVLIYE